VKTLVCLALALSAAVSGATAAAQPATPAGHPQVRGALALLDRWIEAHQVYAQIPGAAVGVVLDQELIWSNAYGFANVAQERPTQADTLYSICSISKLFTGVALMQQRDAGRLQLDDPVAEHLDWFDIEQAHDGSGPITVRGLLTHSSGLPRESVNAYWNPDYPFPSRDALIQGMAGQQTLYPSDTYFQYSNLALTLAGEIAAAKAGRPYVELVQERILSPLGLDDTRPYLPRDLHGTAMAVGYSARNRAGERFAEPPFDTAGVTPAAGFTSNVPDLARFASWQFRLLAAPGSGAGEVLKASTLREMQRVHWIDPDWKTTWGLAFAVQKVEEETMVSHGGSCPGYTTAFTMMPEHQLAVIVLMNANGVEPGLVARNAYRLLGPALKKAKDGDAAPEPPDFSSYEGLYHNRPWSSEVAIVQQGDRLLVADLPSRDVSENLTRLEREDGDVFRRVREDDDDLGERWTFTRDASGAVTGVGFHGVRMTRAP
jgi:CubicO group peptidase (beta-lactamase class C family)